MILYLYVKHSHFKEEKLKTMKIKEQVVPVCRKFDYELSVRSAYSVEHYPVVLFIQLARKNSFAYCIVENTAKMLL